MRPRDSSRQTTRSLRAKTLTSCVTQSHCSRKSSVLHRQGHQSRRLWLPLGPRGEEAVAAAAPSSSPRAPCAPRGRLATPDAHAQQLPRLLGCGSGPHLGGQAGRRGPEWACEAEGCHKHKETTHTLCNGRTMSSSLRCCVCTGDAWWPSTSPELPASPQISSVAAPSRPLYRDLVCVSGVSCELYATRTNTKTGVCRVRTLVPVHRPVRQPRVTGWALLLHPPRTPAASPTRWQPPQPRRSDLG